MSGPAASIALGLLHLAPALALFALLLARRYPGERAVARLAALRRPPQARGRASAGPARLRRLATRPRGGLLLASSLAERGPPASIAALRALAAD